MNENRMKQHSMPILDEEEFKLVSHPHISRNTITQYYKLIKKLPNNFLIYHGLINGGFTAGVFSEEDPEVFIPLVHVSCTKPDDEDNCLPAQLDDKNIVQVKMVLVTQVHAMQAYTKKTYEVITEQWDLVSDRVHYRGARGLWKSLARTNSHIYVWDGNTEDYIRDWNMKPLKYDGKNIQESLIWGPSDEHSKRILVATHKTLK